MWNSSFLSYAVRVPIYFSVVLILVHVLNILTGMQLGVFGIYPRDLNGLPGIITAPLIHGDFQHLFSNLIPMFVMTLVIILFYPRVAIKSMLFIYVFTGLTVWLFARSVFHIGASGVLYGFISFVFWLGIFRKSPKSIILALIMVLMYSGYIEGILPNQPGISWESHLFGGLVGILTAFLFRSQIEDDEKPKVYDWELEEAKKEPFLPHDTFDMTKSERASQQGGFWQSNDTRSQRLDS
jgi:membrane associated rhomboid family serine protease